MQHRPKKESHPIRNFFITLIPLLLPIMIFNDSLANAATNPRLSQQEGFIGIVSIPLAFLFMGFLSYQLSDKSNDRMID